LGTMAFLLLTSNGCQIWKQVPALAFLPFRVFLRWDVLVIDGKLTQEAKNQQALRLISCVVLTVRDNCCCCCHYLSCCCDKIKQQEQSRNSSVSKDHSGPFDIKGAFAIISIAVPKTAWNSLRNANFCLSLNKALTAHNMGSAPTWIVNLCFRVDV